MTPAQAIGALDRQLAAHGQTIKLRRYASGSDVPVDVPCPAFVRGYRADELIAGIDQADSKFVLSPTTAGGEPWPEVGDWLVIDGRQRRIEAVAGIKLGDVVVRIEGQVKG